MASSVQPTGQDVMAEMARQQQLALMGTVRGMFLQAMTCTPLPSAMPLEVRKYMHQQISNLLKLFAPQNEEEEKFYAAE